MSLPGITPCAGCGSHLCHCIHMDTVVHADACLALCTYPWPCLCRQAVLRKGVAEHLGTSKPGRGPRASQLLALWLLRLSVGLGRIDMHAIHSAACNAMSADTPTFSRCASSLK